jgi:hypothetical protein
MQALAKVCRRLGDGAQPSQFGIEDVLVGARLEFTVTSSKRPGGKDEAQDITLLAA